MKLEESSESSEKTRETPDGIDFRGNRDRAAWVINCLQGFDSQTKEDTVSYFLFLLHYHYTLVSTKIGLCFYYFVITEKCKQQRPDCHLLALQGFNNGQAHKPKKNSESAIICTYFLRTTRKLN